MSSFGRGKLQGDNTESSRVVSRDGNSIVAEFKTKSGLFSYTTLELVSLDPPNRITFEHLEGPLRYAHEEFVFVDVEGDTELTHSGEFIWHRFPVIGWLMGRLYVKPMFERLLKRHMEEIRVRCEARAACSHVFRKR